jgi:hypothetical protein
MRILVETELTVVLILLIQFPLRQSTALVSAKAHLVTTPGVSVSVEQGAFSTCLCVSAGHFIDRRCVTGTCCRCACRDATRRTLERRCVGLPEQCDIPWKDRWEAKAAGLDPERGKDAR